MAKSRCSLTLDFIWNSEQLELGVFLLRWVSHTHFPQLYLWPWPKAKARSILPCQPSQCPPQQPLLRLVQHPQQPLHLVQHPQQPLPLVQHPQQLLSLIVQLSSELIPAPLTNPQALTANLTLNLMILPLLLPSIWRDEDTVRMTRLELSSLRSRKAFLIKIYLVGFLILSIFLVLYWLDSRKTNERVEFYCLWPLHLTSYHQCQWSSQCQLWVQLQNVCAVLVP